MVIPDHLVRRGWRVTAGMWTATLSSCPSAARPSDGSPRGFVVNDGRPTCTRDCGKTRPASRSCCADAYTGSVAPEHLTTEEFLGLLTRAGRGDAELLLTHNSEANMPRAL